MQENNTSKKQRTIKGGINRPLHKEREDIIMKEIKTLADVKRAINNGYCFTIRKHYIKPELEGQRRKPNITQTNGFYSVIPGEPKHPVSLANFGKGYWADYGKASDWSFENGICKQTFRGSEIWEIEFDEDIDKDSIIYNLILMINDEYDTRDIDNQGFIDYVCKNASLPESEYRRIMKGLLED